MCLCECIKDMQIEYLPIVPHSPELQSSSSIAPFCVSLDLLLKTLEDCLSQGISCALPGGCKAEWWCNLYFKDCSYCKYKTIRFGTQLCRALLGSEWLLSQNTFEGRKRDHLFTNVACAGVYQACQLHSGQGVIVKKRRLREGVICRVTVLR